ncbi:MAG TPA: hypothetical protein VIJ14_10625 [Rhabdochlamydiaceae bacterium]
MSSNFWNQPAPKPPKPWAQPDPRDDMQPIEIDEEAMAVLQEDPNVDIFEEEEEDTALLMSDVNLRLEQGRLYQMILQTDIFAETNADPRAIKNVQREIRRYARERMETMVGIRQEQQKQETIISSPFNDTEVMALKMIASKVTKGASEAPQAPVPQVQAAPKKDSITPISGTLRPNATPAKTATPLSNKAKAPLKPQPKPVAKSAINKDESALQKPIEEMTPEELSAHNKAAEDRTKNRKAAQPNNLVPHPSPEQLYNLYSGMAANMKVKLAPASE